MKQIIIILSAFLFLFSCKSEPAEETKKEIEYENIPGTRIFIKPPYGYFVQTNFVGYKKDENSGIEAEDFPGNFYDFQVNYNQQAMERKGLTVLNTSKVKIDGHDGNFMEYQMLEEAKGYSVVWGDSSFCAVLFGTYKIGDTETADQLKQTLLSAKYDKKFKARYDSMFVVFTLDDKDCKFKLARNSINSQIYSENGINKPDFAVEPYLIVHNVPYDGTTTLEKMFSYMVEGTKASGYDKVIVKNIKTEKVNGYETHEGEIHSVAGAVTYVIYSFVAVKGNNAVTIQGGCGYDHENNLSEFRKLSRTIKIFD